jgi:hypothetical protein
VAAKWQWARAPAALAPVGIKRMICKEKWRLGRNPTATPLSRKNQDNLKDKSTGGQSLALAPSAFCASRLRSLGDRNGPEKTKP